ncbi:hypothetical protein [Microbacterium marmarense]|uniref:Restriction endonuclease subunit S n=1 Tax=Microbacterium marmarense TaxID=3122051 RepID=A0ABU8LSJ0_9MICO
MVHRPAWFKDGFVYVSYADTVGINKDGNTLFRVDTSTGKRTTTIDDKVEADVDALRASRDGATSRWVEANQYSVGVPAYYSEEYVGPLVDLLESSNYSKFESRTLAELIADGQIVARSGHGSPSADMRDGEIPYIKVSDIRAGQVNINPTNLVRRIVAERFWRGDESGLKPFDLVTPVRASKNIGEFALLMPGQEEIVLTKEVLILRPGPTAEIDNFYLLWALSLKAVRNQWKRIVFMQTNREDVGRRYLEVAIPWTDDANAAAQASQAFRDYYQGMQKLRGDFVQALYSTDEHHVFLGKSDASPDDIA